MVASDCDVLFLKTEGLNTLIYCTAAIYGSDIFHILKDPAGMLAGKVVIQATAL
jgi:hypothetical protein